MLKSQLRIGTTYLLTKTRRIASKNSAKLKVYMFSLKLFISVAEPVETGELACARWVVGARSCTLIFKVNQPLNSH